MKNMFRIRPFGVKSDNRKWLGLSIIVFVVALAGAVASAQDQGKVPRIGLVSGSVPGAPNVEAFRRELRDLGYIEGRNIALEFRFARGKVDKLPDLVAELVRLKVDVLVPVPIQAIQAAKQATGTIPIVVVTSQDPVERGLIDSLARPGGNITGVTRLTRELNGKRLELLKEVIPDLSHVAILRDADSATTIAFEEYETAARALKMKLQSVAVRAPNPDLEGAFQAVTVGPANALIAIRGSLLNSNRRRVLELAVKYRLPAMYEGSDYVEAGGLMSYATNDADSFRRAAWYVDKILKGSRPADLPVEQPVSFEFVVNLKAAKQIGLTIPPNVLARAQKVIQ